MCVYAKSSVLSMNRFLMHAQILIQKLNITSESLINIFEYIEYIHEVGSS